MPNSLLAFVAVGSLLLTGLFRRRWHIQPLLYSPVVVFNLCRTHPLLYSTVDIFTHYWHIQPLSYSPVTIVTSMLDLVLPHFGLGLGIGIIDSRLTLLCLKNINFALLNKYQQVAFSSQLDALARPAGGEGARGSVRLCLCNRSPNT